MRAENDEIEAFLTLVSRWEDWCDCQRRL